MNKDVSEVSISTHQLDENGLVACWLVEAKVWAKRSPIDAREGIAVGGINLTGPDGDVATSIERMSDNAIEAAFAAMSKSQLRQLCVANKVDHTGMDSKTSLVKRLVTSGTVPQ